MATGFNQHQVLMDQGQLEIQIILELNLSKIYCKPCVYKRALTLSFGSLVLALVTLVCKCCTMAVKHSEKKMNAVWYISSQSF